MALGVPILKHIRVYIIHLHIRNNLFSQLFTVINYIYGDLDFLYGLELLILSSGTGIHNSGIWSKLATCRTAKILIC